MSIPGSRSFRLNSLSSCGCIVIQFVGGPAFRGTFAFFAFRTAAAFRAASAFRAAAAFRAAFFFAFHAAFCSDVFTFFHTPVPEAGAFGTIGLPPPEGD